MKCMATMLLLATLPSLTWAATGCRSLTSTEAKLIIRKAQACPTANPTSCVCKGHGRPIFDCPGSPSDTGWQSTGKKCVSARPDGSENWTKHAWYYPADYCSYCGPLNKSLPGSPGTWTLASWPEAGSYHCTKVANVAHSWVPSNAGYDNNHSGAAWCTKSSCYVDPCTCNKEDFAPSSWFAGTTGDKIFYSYAQCGATNTFTAATCTGAADKTACAATSGCLWEGAADNSTNATTTTAAASALVSKSGPPRSLWLMPLIVLGGAIVL